MIPRIIHYCWFSNDPFPPQVQECIESWKQYLPDWKFVLWDYDKVKNIDSVWLKECISARKWAFAADFVRLWAIYHEGGVYLDSDVILHASLDSFLADKMFIGREFISHHTFDDGEQYFLTSHCFGAEPFHPFIKLNLSYYEDRHFVTCQTEENIPDTLRYDMQLLPYIQSRLAETMGYTPSVYSDEIQKLSSGITIYPAHYFCYEPPFHPGLIHFAQHLALGNWRDSEYFARRQPKPYSFRYKIRWRIVKIVDRIAQKLDYKMIRMHPDGRF